MSSGRELVHCPSGEGGPGEASQRLCTEMDAGGRSSPRPGLDDSFGSATNDPDMGHGLLQREMSRLEEEVASLKTKLRNAQDQILALEKVRSKLSALVPELV